MHTSALQIQEGGKHYKDYVIQPIEFIQKNGWDFCAASAFKYTCRHESKGGLTDLKKARHCGEVRLEFFPVTEWRILSQIRSIFGGRKTSHEQGISIEDFISKNHISDPAKVATLVALDRWVRGVDAQGFGFFANLNTLMQTAYPNSP